MRGEPATTQPAVPTRVKKSEAATPARENASVARPARPRGEPSTDPRVRLSRERVLSATLELLTESGLGGLTIDDVSRRSGVAKTTIYRHWSNRNALIVDACLRMSDGDEDPPDTGSLEGDLRAILSALAGLLASARWSSIMPSIVDAAERDPEIAEVHSRLQIWHAAPMRAALERAVERGQLRPEVDISAMASALRGPLYFRRWFTREPIDAAFIDFVVAGALAAVAPGAVGDPDARAAPASPND